MSSSLDKKTCPVCKDGMDIKSFNTDTTMGGVNYVGIRYYYECSSCDLTFTTDQSDTLWRDGLTGINEED